MSMDPFELANSFLTRSLAGETTLRDLLPERVEAGLERYHVDLSRREVTFYLADGDSRVAESRLPEFRIAGMFSREGMIATIRRLQGGQISLASFLERTAAAGCVGYFVQFRSCQVIYFGRDGVGHVEPFPPAPRVLPPIPPSTRHGDSPCRP